MKSLPRFFRHTEWSLFLAIVVVVVLVALADSRHDYWHKPYASAMVILRQTSLLGIFARGPAVVIIAGGIDLSSGSVIAFSGTVCAALMVVLAPEEMVKLKPAVGLGVITAAIAGTVLVGLLIGSLHA